MTSPRRFQHGLNLKVAKKILFFSFWQGRIGAEIILKIFEKATAQWNLLVFLGIDSGVTSDLAFQDMCQSAKACRAEKDREQNFWINLFNHKLMMTPNRLALGNTIVHSFDNL